MAHLTSAAALRTARQILKGYDLIVRSPETLKSGRIDHLTNSEVHVATVIDYASNIYQLTSLRPEIIFWQTRLRYGTATAPQIAGFLKKLVEAFDALPKDSVTDEAVVTTFAPPPQFTSARPFMMKISKPAKEVSRYIYHFYEPHSKIETMIVDEQIHRLKIAYCAEATLGLRRAYQIFPKIKSELSRLVDGHATEIEVKKIMRDVGIELEYIPTYEDRREEGKILS